LRCYKKNGGNKKMRPNRIKEYRWSQTISATSTEAFTSDQSINGEILEVDVKYGLATGSLFITTSGNSNEVWRANTASGAGTRTFYPRVLTQLSTGSVSVAGGARPTPYVCNAPLILNTGSILSGTTAVDVTVRYR
jgi:hypothetical protein